MKNNGIYVNIALLLLIIALVSLTLPLARTDPTSPRKAVIFKEAVVVERRYGFMLDNEGFVVELDGVDGYYPYLVEMRLIVKGEVQNISVLLDTNGYVHSISYMGDTYVLARFYQLKRCYLRTVKGAKLKVSSLVVVKAYVKTEEAEIRRVGDEYVLEFDSGYREMMDKFTNVVATGVDVLLDRSYQLVALYDASGHDQTDYSGAFYVWAFNKFSIFYTFYSLVPESPFDPSGKIKVVMREANDEFFDMLPRGLAQAFLTVSVESSPRRVVLNPGENITIRVEDVFGPLPEGWKYFGEFRISVEGMDVDFLEFSNASMMLRYLVARKGYLTGKVFTIRNPESFPINFTYTITVNVAKPLPTKTRWIDGNLLEARFDAPEEVEEPYRGFVEVSIGVLTRGLFNYSGLYTPDGRLVHDVKLYEDEYDIEFWSVIHAISEILLKFDYGAPSMGGEWRAVFAVPEVIVRGDVENVEVSKPIFGEVERNESAIIALYSLGERAAFNVTRPIVELGDFERKVFGGWQGDLEANESSLEFIVDEARVFVIEPVWRREFLVSVESDYGSVVGGGWYPGGSEAKISVSPTEVVLGEGVKKVFAGWTGDVEGKSAEITFRVDSPKTVKALWDTYYLVSVETPIGTASGGGWYREGETARISVWPTETGFLVRDVFSHWELDGEEISEPEVEFTVTGPVRAVAVWRKDYTIALVLAFVVVAVLAFAVYFVARSRKERKEK